VNEVAQFRARAQARLMAAMALLDQLGDANERLQASRPEWTGAR
jgi:hypothetical protein